MHFKFKGHHLWFFHFRFGRIVFPWIPMESRTHNLYNVVGISLTPHRLSCEGYGWIKKFDFRRRVKEV